ncbi:MAG: hypothetical protein ABSA69_03735 [Verrucomicrobiota bacterium]|jgi:hypothetical protein
MQQFALQGIGDYTDLIKLLLGESAKYFLLLLSAVLAIRLWRRLAHLPGPKRWTSLCLAVAVSAASCTIGCFSMKHSLSLLYSHYGMRAFRAGNITSALLLFRQSSHFWHSADSKGREGVCELLLNNSNRGLLLLHNARAERKGRSTPFEQYYQGVFYYFHEQPDQAIPLLEESTEDIICRWYATVLLSAIQIEKNDPITAARLMDPYQGVEVKYCDHAYVIASLDLWQGKEADARVLLDKYPAKDLTEFWQRRFEKLRRKTAK